MSEPTVSVSPPPSASSPVSDPSSPPPEASVLSSLVLLELELLLPPPQPATTSAAITSRSAAKSAAGRILVIEMCLRSKLGRREHMAVRPPCSSHTSVCRSGGLACVHPGPIRDSQFGTTVQCPVVGEGTGFLIPLR